MDVKAKYIGIQSAIRNNASDLASMGDNCCLFLTLCSIAEEYNESHHNGRRVDIIRCYIDWRARGWLEDEFYCVEQEAMLESVTGVRWHKAVMSELPCPVPDAMYTAEHWKSDVTKGEHFKRRWGDTFNASETVRTGRIVEYYTYTHE